MRMIADSTKPVSSITISTLPDVRPPTSWGYGGKSWRSTSGGTTLASSEPTMRLDGVGAGCGGGAGSSFGSWALTPSTDAVTDFAARSRNPAASVPRSDSGGRVAAALTSGSASVSITWLNPAWATPKSFWSNAI